MTYYFENVRLTARNNLQMIKTARREISVQDHSV